MGAVGMLPRSRFLLLRRALPAYMSAMKESNVQWQSTDAIPAASAVSISSASSSGAEAVGETPVNKEHGVWRIIRGALYLGSAGAVGGCAYGSYAHTTEDVDKYISSLRNSANIKAAEDFDLLEVVMDSHKSALSSCGDSVTSLSCAYLVLAVLGCWVKRLRGSIVSASVSASTKVLQYYLDVRKSIEDQVRGFSAPSSNKLLPDLQPQEQHVFTLVLDLNETLVFSDWKRDRGWRTFKRPGVEAFLEQLAQYYELVIYSDQLSFYVDPVLDRLDQKGCIRYRLSRDATQYIEGKHMRDLSKLNRDPSRVIYLSGHAVETTLNPENSLPIKAWKLEGDDTSLLDLLPFLEYVARNRPADIRTVLASYEGQDIASEFRVRHQEYQRRMQERKQQSRFWRGSAMNR